MNLVIHFRGTLKQSNQIELLLNFVRNFSLEKGWNTLEWEDSGTLFAEKDSSASPFKKTLDRVEQKGVIVQINNALFVPIVIEKPMHALVQFFPAEGDAWVATNHCFVPTDDASVEEHMMICELLHEIHKRFIPNLEVYDEGRYFETGDRKRLEKNRLRHKNKKKTSTSLTALWTVLEEAAKLENPFAKKKVSN